MTGLDWRGMLKVGLCDLDLTPREFWDLTPQELLILIGQDRWNMPMRRAGLEALIAAFPDHQEDYDNG